MASNPTYLSRRQVAALLSVDESVVKARDNATFHPVKAADGSWRYPPEEIAAVLRGLNPDDSGGGLSGAVCAEVFEQFKGGKPMADVVIATKQPPSVIRALRGEFDAMTETLSISRENLQVIDKVFEADIKDDAQLIAVLRSLVSKLELEYHRGYDDALAEASDVGEIVDRATGKTRPIEAAEVTAALRTVNERWRDHATAPEQSKG